MFLSGVQQLFDVRLLRRGEGGDGMAAVFGNHVASGLGDLMNDAMSAQQA